MKKTARDTALAVLAACRKDGAWSDGRLKSEIEREGLERSDAALATHIAYGVMQNMALIDFYISQYCSYRLNKLEPKVLDILRVGVYQLVFLTKIPESAAVNEAVEMTRRSSPKAAGLVNATLRSLARAKNALPEPIRGDIEEYLSIKYSHPRWLVAEFIAALGEDGAEKLLRINNEIAPLVVQANTLAGTAEAACESLRSEGVTVKKTQLEGCFEISGAGGVEKLTAFREGLIRVQDAAAMACVIAGAPKRGELVVDGCSAPGGKAFAAGALMENEGRILAFDIHEHKLRLIEEGAERLHVKIIEARQNDARRVIPELCGKADLVIADVPCSGLGTIRKKPDVRYKNYEELAGLPQIQLEILKALSNYVRPGGRMIYSTCTLRRCENEDVVQSFLESSGDFALQGFDTPVCSAETGMITMWPHIHNVDGFFICRMTRR